jgi:hypothetical protein
MTEESPQFVSVHTIANRFEADLLLDALEQEGIPTLLRTFEETPYDGLFVSQRGWGKIMVPEALTSQARQVIEPLLKTVQPESPYVAPSEIDPHLWERLRAADPQTVCHSANVRYNGALEAYEFPFLNTRFHCFPHQEAIEPIEENPYVRLDFEFYLATLYYLLEAQPREPSGNWISEKDLPGGAFFFRGPHVFPFSPLLKLFDPHPHLFDAASQVLGGTRVDMGDAAYSLQIYPRVPLLFVLWKGDDEFEAAMNVRFDENILLHLKTLDTLWALVNVVCRSLRTAGKQLSEGTPS